MKMREVVAKEREMKIIIDKMVTTYGRWVVGSLVELVQRTRKLVI